MGVARSRLWTIVEDRLDRVVLKVRGELSSATAPALDSLVSQLTSNGERVALIDLREATLLPPAAERMLERWGAQPTQRPGTYALGLADQRPSRPGQSVA